MLEQKKIVGISSEQMLIKQKKIRVFQGQSGHFLKETSSKSIQNPVLVLRVDMNYPYWLEVISRLRPNLVYNHQYKLIVNMSKSPAKDFSKLIQTHAKTVKKEEVIREEPAYPSKLLRYDTINTVNDLKTKLDAALRHNTRLLDENSTLGEMANDLRYQLKSKSDQLTFLQKESDDLLRKTANERQNLHIELQAKQSSHEEQLSRLLKEISNLHDQKNNLQLGRQKEIQKLKSEFEASLMTQLKNVKNCQNNSKDLYQAQIRNLKEAVEDKENEIENVRSVQRMEKQRLQDNIRALQKEIVHSKNAHALELKTLKHSFQTDFESEKKRIENEKSLQLSGYNLKIKRLKKDVAEKNLEIEHTTKKMTHQEELLSMESVSFKREKESMLAELKSNDIHAKNLLTQEKNKLEELNRLEIQNLTKLFETNIDELNGQNFKLKQLIECKKEELRDLYDQNQRIKESYGKENQLVRGQNNDLKDKIRSLQLQKKDEMENFKIKMANLLENDIKCMSNYYENQLKSYIDRTDQLQKINAGLRERVFTTIQENDEIRKNFEIQNSKLRARVQDLKIKMASIQLEHKEQVSNLGSKVQLTSQTLIRESEHKEKSKSQYEEEKRKFHYLANSKDKEISDLMAMMENMKKMHEDELKVVRAEKMQMQSELDDAEEAVKRVRAAADEELRVKDERLKTLVFSNQKELNEIKELEDKVEVLQKNVIKAKKQYQHLQLINASLAQELGLSKGFIESLQLESNAAIEDERSKMKAFIGTHEVSIREYFEDKLKSKEKDVDSLRRQLAEKEESLRDLLTQYAALEKRFDMMMESNTKVRQFEQQVKQLGLDENLVKNMAQLFKK